MLKEEANWVKEQINLITSKEDISPIANIGCSDEKQYEFQPWVKDLNNFIKSKGTLLNIDIKRSPEVDLVGDLLDIDFINEIKKRNFKFIICANILTNIVDRNSFIRSLNSIVPKNSYLMITVSRKYPFVADPVDTLYRPTPNDLINLFPNFDVIDNEIIESDSYLRLLIKKKKTLAITVFRLLIPFYKYNNWLNLVKYLPNALDPVSASCVVLKKKI